jgi:hypothetical protein
MREDFFSRDGPDPRLPARRKRSKATAAGGGECIAGQLLPGVNFLARLNPAVELSGWSQFADGAIFRRR